MSVDREFHNESVWSREYLGQWVDPVRPDEARINAAEQTFGMYRKDVSGFPSHTPAESAWGRDYPGPWAGPLTPDDLGVRSLSGIARSASAPCCVVAEAGYACKCHTPAIPPAPVDPLDVEHDGVKLRDLLYWDGRSQQETPMLLGRHRFTPTQRAAVSA